MHAVPLQLAMAPSDRAVLRLKRERREARARAHPWIFKGDVADASPVEPGSIVTVLDAGDGSSAGACSIRGRRCAAGS